MIDVPHTPHPWYLAPNDGGKHYEPLICSQDGVGVAQICDRRKVTNTSRWPELEANALLLTAAPELFAACDPIAAQIERIGILGHDCEITLTASECKAIIAAIEKATTPPLSQVS